MLACRESSSARRRCLPIVALVAFLVLPFGAAAEIIIDDFDEPFEIILSEMQEQPLTILKQTHAGVGPLAAERQVNFVAVESRPTGRLYTDPAVGSSFNIEIDRLRPTGDDPLVVGTTLQYVFDELDITQGGKNNRLVIDFGFLRSSIPISEVSAAISYAETIDAPPAGPRSGEPQPAVHTEIRTHPVADLMGISARNGPFSLELPFDAQEFNAARTRGIQFSISPASYTEIDSIDFSAAIDRVRITVPEPSMSVSAVLLLALLAVGSRPSFMRFGR